jgi:acid phosphatase family membrane protein YuiD
MFWHYVSFLLVTVVTSQLIKLMLKPRANRASLAELENTLLYYSGPPSSHAAVLSMTLLYIKDRVTIDQSVFIVLLVMAILWLYEIFMQRKRFDSMVGLLGLKQKETGVVKNREFHGHSLVDILSGIILGVVVYWLITSLAPATLAVSPLVDLA